MPELIAKLEQFGELRLARKHQRKTAAALVPRPSIACCSRNGANSSYAGVLTPSLGLYSNTRSRFAPSPSGMSNNPGLRRLIWWPMMVAWHSVTICQTLDLTDVCSGWTETEAVPNKAQVWVFEAMQANSSAPAFSVTRVWTPTTVPSSSTRNCCVIVSKSGLLSRALVLIARMTTVMSNKRTIRWSGRQSVINVSTRRRS